MNVNAVVCHKQLAAASCKCLKLQQGLDASRKQQAKKTLSVIWATMRSVEARLKAVEGHVK